MDEDKDDDDDEHPLPSLGAIDFVRLATRYLPHERPTALQTLAKHLWLLTEVRVTREDGATSSAELQQLQLFSLEGMLGKLELD